MKKNTIFIFVLALILNLLPQTSDALTLHTKNNSVIYDASEEEKEAWESVYLQYAKHEKLVSKNATVLDILRIDKDEYDKGISNTIVHKIMNGANHRRNKIIVKNEKDNGYIDEEVEKHYGITPTVRRELLKEIDEDEQKERAKETQFWWKTAKTGVMFGSTITAFIVSIFLKQDIDTSAAKATLAFIATSTVISGAEFSTEIYNKHKKGKDDDEIKIPMPKHMPQIPANHVRVDLYSL